MIHIELSPDMDKEALFIADLDMDLMYTGDSFCVYPICVHNFICAN